MKRAIIESRPYLLLSLIFAISYYFVQDSNVPGVYLMLWKGAGVAFLAVYALRRIHTFDGKLIAAVMAFGALGDMLIEFDFIMGAAAFLIGHIVAIGLYWRHRRNSTSFSQKALAALLIPITIFIAWSLPSDRADAAGIAIYTLFLAVMAAMAWTSSFPRYRVGMGALLFVASDLLIFSELGPLESSTVPNLFIWPLYYLGQFMIATGVVRTLRNDMHIANP